VIDLHSHVLPGLDDGPPDTIGSVAMADAAAAAGTRTLAATPHLREDHPAVRPAELPDRVAELNELLHRYELDLRVVTGAEVAITVVGAMSDDELREVTLGGNGRDLLLETPYGELPSTYEALVEELGARGFRVLAAHPERNPTLQADPARLGRLVDAGLLVQLTAGSLTLARRSRPRRLALTALENGWAHVLASDAHSATWRPPDLALGLKAARRALPHMADELAWMVNDAPRAILEGAPLPPRPPRYGQRSALGRLRRGRRD
jgi:protein-tyrosine phosphatase